MTFPNNCNDIPNDKLEDTVEKNENDYKNCPDAGKDRLIAVMQGDKVLYQAKAIEAMIRALEKRLKKEYPNGIPVDKAAEEYKKAIDNIIKPGKGSRKIIDETQGPITVVVGVLCPSKNPTVPSITPVPGLFRP